MRQLHELPSYDRDESFSVYFLEELAPVALMYVYGNDSQCSITAPDTRTTPDVSLVEFIYLNSLLSPFVIIHMQEYLLNCTYYQEKSGLSD
ncbi:hypothetical protein JTE90_003541 [Oedothorax gibbosus]|uniref:Uncharacterized protein n=1 Tax=Oedothorax gibbosus TaxID=931172 RepID=A0AAV6UQI3_9ARAC|nr:hypothetical protein JTE90_003541 [Oedothorax gibbosus]